MNVAFKLESKPLKIDLSGASHSHVDRMERASPRLRSCSSSSEFQTVLEALYDLKINEASTQSNDVSTKYSNEKGDWSRVPDRRQSLVDLSPSSAVSEFSRALPMTHRKSLPSLGPVAVDMQYTVPSSKSYPGDLAKNVAGRELDIIQEIPRKGKQRPHHLAKIPIRPESKRRRSSFGAQGSTAPSKTTVVPKTKQRRSSCSKFPETPSVWRVKAHKRSLDIYDEDDRLYPYFQTRRSSFVGFPTVGDQSQNRQSLLPKIGRRNSFVQNDDND